VCIPERERRGHLGRTRIAVQVHGNPIRETLSLCVPKKSKARGLVWRLWGNGAIVEADNNGGAPYLHSRASPKIGLAMRNTSALIDRLVDDLRPVRPIRALLRAFAWLGIAALVVLVVVSLNGLRPDLMRELSDPAFAVNRTAAIGTAIVGAVAALQLSIPGRSAMWIVVPLPFATVWLGMMSYGCIDGWLVRGDDRFELGRSYECFQAITFTSVPLGFLMFRLVRHAALVRPITTTAAAGLALAAACEGGLTFYHDVAATLMDVLVHLAGVAVVIALALAGGRLLLSGNYLQPFAEHLIARSRESASRR